MFRTVIKPALLIGSLSCLLLSASRLWPCPPAIAPACPLSSPVSVRYTQQRVPNGLLHTVYIPKGSPMVVRPVVSNSLKTLKDLSVWVPPAEFKVVAALNGGFFDPANGLTTSFVSMDGQTWLNPRDNKRLTENPALKLYLEKIFNRSEFRVLACHEGNRYDIVPHQSPIPAHCTLKAALGAGPQLLPANTAKGEGFIDHDARGRLIRDPLGIRYKNARSVLGITAQGDVILMMGAMLPDQPKTSGFSLEDMTAYLRQAGAVKALALDGGSSSGLFYEGTVSFGKYDAKGQPVVRPLKSVLAVGFMLEE